MRTALVAVAVVWLLGCTWSFQEQSAFATSKGFAFPHLLPLVIDGFAVSMAGVSWAASLDARPALPARLATLVAVGASSASNGAWAYLRAHHDLVAVALGMAVPIAANLAFEVLLAELRRQVQRRRGLPAPVAVPYPRLIRLALAPWQTFQAWRTVVLTITAPDYVRPGFPSTIPGVASSESTATGDPATAVGATPPARTSPAGPTAVEATSSAPVVPPAALHSVPPVLAADAAAFPGAAPVGMSAGAGSASSTPRPGDLDVASTSLAAESESPRGRRVAQLVRYLSTHGDASDITGEKVAEILSIEIAPRTGRRLLGEARQLLSTSLDPDVHAHESQVAVGAGR
jgi:hypothetical protein